MSKVELFRIDFRMIHGQVMVKWLKTTGANEIVGINDDVAKDPFLEDIYKMAAPKGITIKVFTRDDSIKYFAKPDLSNNKILVLFKNVEDAYYCFQNGLSMDHVQIGGLGAGPDRINVFGPITLNKTDAELLKKMNDSGVKVIFQQVPDESSVSLDKILKKNDFGLE
jgi:Phosphotransferase system, mannose/fructose/N-acetylgalactosamine-specific component IIB